MKFIKYITMKKAMIIVLLLLVPLILMDTSNIQIDNYNFQQLEKARIILENIPLDAQKFFTLKDFNEQYKADIKTIKNCYYVSNDN